MSGEPIDVVAILGDASRQDAIRRVVAAAHRRAVDLVDLDDLCQRVALKAIYSHRQFRGSTFEQLLAWLGTIALRLMYDELRSAARRPSLIEMERAPEAASDRPDAAEWVDLADETAGLLQRVSRSEAALLRARYRHELSFEQIAQITGVATATLRQQHRRLLERIRGTAESE